MNRRVKVLLASSAVAIAIVAAGALTLSRPNGIRVGDCVSHNGYKPVACDTRKNQLKVVSVGIAGCDAANHLTIFVKDRTSYCAIDTKLVTQAVVNDGDCVKKSTTPGVSLVKVPCTDTGAHQIVKKIVGSANGADCPTAAPTAVINKASNYVLCFKN